MPKLWRKIMDSKWLIWAVVTLAFLLSDLWLATEASHEHDKHPKVVSPIEAVFWLFSGIGTAGLVVSAMMLRMNG